MKKVIFLATLLLALALATFLYFYLMGVPSYQESLKKSLQEPASTSLALGIELRNSLGKAKGAREMTTFSLEGEGEGEARGWKLRGEGRLEGFQSSKGKEKPFLAEESAKGLRVKPLPFRPFLSWIDWRSNSRLLASALLAMPAESEGKETRLGENDVYLYKLRKGKNPYFFKPPAFFRLTGGSVAVSRESHLPVYILLRYRGTLDGLKTSILVSYDLQWRNLV